MVGRLDDALRFQQTALSLRAERQQVLASNIANADTPNYKARDIDFASALKNALAATPQASSLKTTEPGQMAGRSVNLTAGGSPLLYRSEPQGNVDGNTVNVDAERAQFTDNAVRYEAGLTLIGAQIKNLLAAIQG